ncbi:hypothetical protein [Candidatus Protofrankia californiensis]|uniref:hypothetical protein n=1 Tax=Candidatus Protofrankia californiensis TaxID=1839754 RepID=UPI0010415085|nr:hypothetical protein [Candidatus Protofrankia californiensis]
MGNGIGAVLLVVICFMVIGAVIWFGYRYTSRAVRAGDPEAMKRQALASVGVPTFLLSLLVVGISGVATSEIVWQLVRHQPATNANGYAWAGWLVAIAAAAIFLAAVVPLGLLFNAWLPSLVDPQAPPPPQWGFAVVAAQLAPWRSPYKTLKAWW